MTNDLPLTLRLRRFLSDWFSIVVVALVVVVLLGSYGTYLAYGTTAYDTEEVVVSTMNESTSFEHSAVVRNESDVWTEGERVHDRPKYYMRLTPILDVEYAYDYDLQGANEGSLSARSDVSLVIRSQNEDGETLWRVERPVASETTESLSPDGTHELSFSVNTTRVARNISRIQSDIGDPSSEVQVLLRAVTTVNGSVASKDVSSRYTSELPLVLRPPTYRTVDARTVSRGTPLQTETRRERLEPPLIMRYGAPLGAILGVASLVGLLYSSHRDLLSLSQAEREQCLLAEQRKQFDDWITRGEVPGIDQYQTVVKVSSLSGLVDLAIDTNNRVIEDDNTYYVLRGREDVVYMYAPPTSSVYNWLFGDIAPDGTMTFSRESSDVEDVESEEGPFGFAGTFDEFDDGSDTDSDRDPTAEESDSDAGDTDIFD